MDFAGGRFYATLGRQQMRLAYVVGHDIDEP
jgi:hypothetical protein